MKMPYSAPDSTLFPKIAGFDAKLDTNFGPRADTGGSAQFVPDKTACWQREWDCKARHLRPTLPLE
jgi:hypothetical protein